MMPIEGQSSRSQETNLKMSFIHYNSWTRSQCNWSPVQGRIKLWWLQLKVKSGGCGELLWEDMLRCLCFYLLEFHIHMYLHFFKRLFWSWKLFFNRFIPKFSKFSYDITCIIFCPLVTEISILTNIFLTLIW